MAVMTIFEQHQSGGTATFLITNTGTINLEDLSDAILLVDGSGVSPGDEGYVATVDCTVSITKLHWSGGVTITSKNASGGSFTIPLTGNGAWCQFNGWTPVDCTDNISISENGTLFIEIKKLSGFTGRNDYSN